MTLKDRLHRRAVDLAKEHSSNARLSTAIGIGAFVGSTPFFGLHTLIAIALSRVLRLNVLAMTLGTQVSLPFLAPLIVFASVQFGHFASHGAWLDLGRDELSVSTARAFFADWLLGCMFVGSGLATLGFVFSYGALSVLRKSPPEEEQPRQAWTGRSRGTSLGYSVFLSTLRVFGLRGAYLLLPCVTLYYCLFARSARRASREFLDRALGPRTWLARQVDTWRHFEALGRSLVDRTWIMAGGHNDFTFEHENVERILDTHREGNGLILLSAHLGSWGMAGGLLDGLHPNLVVYDNEADGIRRFFERLGNEAPRMIVVNKGPTASLEILRAIRNGEAVAMMADRILEDTPALRLPFLGEPADFPKGPFIVAVLSGAPVVMTFSMKEGARHHHFFALPIHRPAPVPHGERDAAVEALARQFVEQLEQVAKRYPYQWYNFYPFWRR